MRGKMHMAAPLPFVGQKRMFANEYIKILPQFNDKTVFVDLFGGSGLLSHITKHLRPEATVVYNDYDNYRERLAHIPQTNALLADLRAIVGNTPKHKRIDGVMREKMFERLRHEEQTVGYIDFITISASVMFSMKYELSIEEMEKQTLYNNIRKNDYPTSEDYLEGLTIESCDYRELYEKYKDEPNVVFIVDPPYLSTEVGTYKMYWHLSDYLDVLNVLKGKPFVYFTSDKSSIIELCEWLGKNKTLGNPFEGCKRFEFNAHVNFDAGYKDMMLVKSNAA